AADGIRDFHVTGVQTCALPIFVVAPNVLGGCQGSTGPSSAAPDGSPWGSRFPLVTARDQVAAELELTDRLGIERWALVVGASMEIGRASWRERAQPCGRGDGVT